MAPVGAAEDAKRIVGAGAMAGAPAERSGMVGAGAVGRGGPAIAVGGPTVAVGGAMLTVGGPPGTGGLTGATTDATNGGFIDTVADGTAGGEPEAFKVTRMVSFLRGILDVCLDGAGGWFSFSLIRSRFFWFLASD